jgi:hypothetical protein
MADKMVLQLVDSMVGTREMRSAASMADASVA